MLRVSVSNVRGAGVSNVSIETFKLSVCLVFTE